MGPGPKRSEQERLAGVAVAVRPAVRVAPFEASQLDQVHQLYSEVFGGAGAGAFLARWRWAHMENLYPGSSPKWVLVDGEQVVGFLAAIPIPYRIQGADVVAHTPCDYMVHPRYRFHGIRLMRELFRSCDNCVTCDDILATIRVTQYLGARDIGQLTRYVKVLDGRALRSRKASPRLPPPAWWLATQWLSWPDTLRGRRRSPSGVRCQPGFDSRFEHFFQRLSSAAPVMTARDLRFLEWRYGPASPHADREIGTVTGPSGDLKGYVIFRLSADGHSGTVLDLQVLDPTDTDMAALLLRFAVTRLREGGAWVVRYRHLGSAFTPSEGAPLGLGFVARGGHRVLVRFRDPRHAVVAEVAANWNYAYGDAEASHALA